MNRSISRQALNAKLGWWFFFCTLCTVLFHLINVRSPFTNSLQNSGHIFTFFFFSVLLFRLTQYYRLSTTARQRQTQVFILGAIVGIAIEVIQPHFGREFSLLDWLYDLIGIFLGLLYCHHEENKKNKLKIVAYLFVIGCSVPTYQFYILMHQKQKFPVLYDFESHWESNRLSVNEESKVTLERDNSWQENPSKAANVTLKGNRHPGIVFKDFPNDWRTYSDLTLELYSHEPETFNLAIRINDRYHNRLRNDRYNQSFNIKPGMNALSINLNTVQNAPEQREMNMAELSKLVIFAKPTKTPLRFSIDNLVLRLNDDTPQYLH